MADEIFTDTEGAREEWVDVRMTDPEKGEWDVDFVVSEGQVEYVDLRIRPDLLAAFVDCLVEDVGDKRAGRVLSNVADRQDIDLPDADSIGDDVDSAGNGADSTGDDTDSTGNGADG